MPVMPVPTSLRFALALLNVLVLLPKCGAASAPTYVAAVITDPANASQVRSQIQAAVNQALSRGDDGIRLPDGNFQFAGQVNATNQVDFVSAGRTTLVKTDLAQFPAAMIKIQCRTERSWEFAGITLIGKGRFIAGVNNYGSNPGAGIKDTGLMLRGQCVNFHIHDSEFSYFTHSGLSIYGFGAAPGVPEGLPTGVIHSNRFFNNFWHGLGYGVVLAGAGTTQPWPTGVLGTGQAVFVEDNRCRRTRHCITGNYGSKYVFRHNVVIDNIAPYAATDAHGENYCGGEACTGTRTYEIYENDYHWTGTWANRAPYAIGIRGGDGVVWNNRTHHTRQNQGFLAVDALSGVDLEQRSYPYPYQIRALYLWNNVELPSGKAWDINIGYSSATNQTFSRLIKLNRDYYLDKKPGYMPYPYPHPFRAQVGAREPLSRPH